MQRKALEERIIRRAIHLDFADRQFVRRNCDFDDNFALSFLSLTINSGGIAVYTGQSVPGLPRDLLGGAITRGVTSNFIATRGIMRPSSRED